MPVARAGLSAVDVADLSSLHTPLRSARVRDRLEPEESSKRVTGDSADEVQTPAPQEKREEASVTAAPAMAKEQPLSGVAAYPSLSAAPREHLIPYSVRLPLSQIDALDKLCRSRNIDKSNLVRDFISAGLKSLGQELAALK